MDYMEVTEEQDQVSSVAKELYNEQLHQQQQRHHHQQQQQCLSEDSDSDMDEDSDPLEELDLWRDETLWNSPLVDVIKPYEKLTEEEREETRMNELYRLLSIDTATCVDRQVIEGLRKRQLQEEIEFECHKNEQLLDEMLMGELSDNELLELLSQEAYLEDIYENRRVSKEVKEEEEELQETSMTFALMTSNNNSFSSIAQSCN